MAIGAFQSSVNSSRVVMTAADRLFAGAAREIEKLSEAKTVSPMRLLLTADAQQSGHLRT